MSNVTILAFILVITTSMIVPVYAELSLLSTDKQFYKKGDFVIIKGKIKEDLRELVNIIIIAPDGNKQITGASTNSSGYFEKPINTLGNEWKNLFSKQGIFNATAFFDDEDWTKTKQVRFDFSLDGSPVVPSAFSTPTQATPQKQTTTQTTTQQSQQQSSQNVQAQTDLKKEFLKFVDPKKDPQYYIDRYNNEPEYKAWFSNSFSGLDIYNVLGVSKTSPTPEPVKTEPEPEPPIKEPEPILQEPQSIKPKLASFVDPKKDPQSYIDRYNNEPSYKAWFDKNYPDMTIHEAVGVEPPKEKKLASFVDPKKDPQSYIDRYNNEPSYKAWFDKSFPDMTIHEAVGVEPPKVGICGPGTEFKDGVCIVKKENKKTSGGGCLIATAAYGTELAPQIQQLRELRDNSLLKTESGSAFMAGFNEFYYSFSPVVADMERQSPVFREAVRLAITPMISTLSILNHVDMDSEASVLGYGLAVISLNIGMYLAAPAIIVYKMRR